MAYIFIDCDGTLTDSKGLIPDSAVSAIKAVQSNGHKVFLCTGRSEAEITDDIRKLNLDGYICSAGAAIVINNELVIDKKIPEEKLKALIQVLDKNDIGYYLESPLGAFVNDKYREFLMEFIKQFDDPVQAEYFMNMLKTIDDADLTKICKLSYCGSKLNKEELEKEVDSFFKVMEDSRRNNESMGEISQNGVDKAHGIDDILNILNGKEEHVIAIGDGENDLDMLERADIGIAIKHAGDNLKKIADYVTDEPEDDGLLKAFKHYSLI